MNHTSVFTYKSVTLNDERTKVELTYCVNQNTEQFDFCESYTFSQPLPDCVQTDSLLRALHLACAVSYYKIFFSNVIVHTYGMDASEATFWNSVFKNGFGEYLYQNKLDPALMATFSEQSGDDSLQHTIRGNQITDTSAGAPVGAPKSSQSLQPKALLGIGGGKDSIVAGELLKRIGINVEGFVMATGDIAGQAADVADVMQVPLQRVARVVDPTLLALQQRPDAYRGHIPVSLIFGLVGSLLAIANQAQYVVVANEDSASIPQAHWAGSAINHQWSKSFEFEQQLQEYLHTHVDTNLHYFSAIRPLSSIAVTKIFSSLDQYFTVFTSDNYVFRIDPSKRPNARWSHDSPKSLSSYILLAAWLPKDQLLRIFGLDFLNEASLQNLFLRLLAISGEPVLDCVGTPSELRACLQQAHQTGQWQQSPLMQLALEHGVLQPDQPVHFTDFISLSQNHAFPLSLQSPLMQAIQTALESPDSAINQPTTMERK